MSEDDEFYVPTPAELEAGLARGERRAKPEREVEKHEGGRLLDRIRGFFRVDPTIAANRTIHHEPPVVGIAIGSLSGDPWTSAREAPESTSTTPIGPTGEDQASSVPVVPADEIGAPVEDTGTSPSDERCLAPVVRDPPPAEPITSMAASPTEPASPGPATDNNITAAPASPASRSAPSGPPATAPTKHEVPARSARRTISIDSSASSSPSVKVDYSAEARALRAAEAKGHHPGPFGTPNSRGERMSSCSLCGAITSLYPRPGIGKETWMFKAPERSCPNP